MSLIGDNVLYSEMNIMNVNIGDLIAKNTKGTPIAIPERGIARACSPNITMI